MPTRLLVATWLWAAAVAHAGAFPLQPPGRAVLVGPAGIVSTVRPTLAWEHVADASWYRVWIEDASGVADARWYPLSAVGCAAAGTPCEVTVDFDLRPGAVSWWVQTWNGEGYGPWSEPGVFSIGPPEPPSLWAPWNGIDTVLPAYTWYAASGATWYRLWVDDSSGHRFDRWYTHAEVGSCIVAVRLCFVTPFVPLQPGAATFWVQAWNPLGMSAWSAPSHFIVPEIVSVLALWEVRGATDGAATKLWALVNNGTNLPLQAGDEVRFAYRWLVRGPADRWVGGVSLAGLPAHEARWYALDWTVRDRGGQYLYYAQIFRDGGVLSAPSELQRFTIGFDSQFNGTAAYPWATTTGAWSLRDNAYFAATGQEGFWSAAEYDPGFAEFEDLDFTTRMRRDGCTDCVNAMRIRHHFDFGYTTDGRFRVAAGSVVLAPPTFSSAIAVGTEWNTLRVVASGDHYWFFVNGTCVWSGFHATAPWTHRAPVGFGFNGDGTLLVDYATLTDGPIAAPPPAPEPVAPAGTITVSTPTYVWTAAAWATAYRVWVDDTTGTRTHEWYDAAAAGCTAGTGVCQITPPVVLQPGGATFWVQAAGAYGVGPWSAPRSFVVAAAPFGP